MLSRAAVIRFCGGTIHNSRLQFIFDSFCGMLLPGLPDFLAVAIRESIALVVVMVDWSRLNKTVYIVEGECQVEAPDGGNWRETQVNNSIACLPLICPHKENFKLFKIQSRIRGLT